MTATQLFEWFLWGAFANDLTGASDEFVLHDFLIQLMGNTLHLTFEGAGSAPDDSAKALAEKYVGLLGKRTGLALHPITIEEFLARTAPKYLRYPFYLLLRAAAWSGVVRLLQPRPQYLDNPTRQQMIRALRQQPKSIVTDIATGLVVPESYEQARAVGRTGDRPLIVLTAGKPQPWSDHEMARQAAAYQEVWIHEIQSQLTRLSTRGRQIVVENSDHGIPENAPGAVISAIEEVVLAVRAGKDGSSAKSVGRNPTIR